jgi:CBS domain containing-hemolysin-like protein
VVLTLVLALFAGFNFRSDVSRFELRRLAGHSREYQQKMRFLEIYPGLKIVVNFLALLTGLGLAFAAFNQWQFLGLPLALAALGLSFFISRAIRAAEATWVTQHLEWFNKYLAWTEILGRVELGPHEPKVHSQAELAHLVSGIDFMPERERDLIMAAIKLPGVKLADLMTPRRNITFVRDSASLGPKIIDELYSTGQRVFPVVHGDLENTLGVICLDDIATVAKGDQTLREAAQQRPAVVNKDLPLLEALDLLLNQQLRLLLVEDKQGKIVGMVELTTIFETLLGRKLS